MSIINKLFKNSKLDCPRCLGKGKVDWDDIKRLNKELKWRPGVCAYCNGEGKIKSKMTSKIDVDNTYLTIDLSKEERSTIINDSQKAKEFGEIMDVQINNSIKQISYLHSKGKLDSNKIAEFYLISAPESEKAEEKKELIDYIDRVILKLK